VLPGEIMRGSIGQMVQFPSWLGKNSTAAKNDRLLQELCQHMRLQWVISYSSFVSPLTTVIPPWVHTAEVITRWNGYHLSGPVLFRHYTMYSIKHDQWILMITSRRCPLNWVWLYLLYQLIFPLLFIYFISSYLVLVPAYLGSLGPKAVKRLCVLFISS